MLKKRLKTLQIILKRPYLIREGIKALFHKAFESYHFEESFIKQAAIAELVGSNQVKILAYDFREGRVSLYELLVLCKLVQEYNPAKVFEIGTFDGMSTLHLAANSSDKSCIWTLDLPSQCSLKGHSPDDLKYIQDIQKLEKCYSGTPYAHKIHQILADSRNLVFPYQGELDFIFIDGGHSLECVSNDTNKSLEALSEKGVIVWHDYTPHCPGVYQYLNELSKKLPLLHIKDTSLVIYQKND